MNMQRFYLLVFLLAVPNAVRLYGQQIPDHPTSIQIFSPHVYNPAMSGSKDFLNINLSARIEGRPKAQILSAHTRLLKKGIDYPLSGSSPSYSNFGVGGYLFNEHNEFFHNIGFSVAGAMHLSLSRKAISFLSLGLSFNGTYSISEGDESDPGNGIPSSTFYPNADLGLYFYNPRVSAGISATNILGNVMRASPYEKSSGLSSRGYHFQAGYKIVLNRAQSIILEPSIYMNAIDSTQNTFYNDINPTLKLYFKNLYLGTYYSSKDLFSYFMLYQFSRLYAGFFIEFPIEKLVNQSNIRIELTIGLNLQSRKITNPKTRFW
jgi:type IX secretion system PorP/SprF family membrane protein